MEVLMAPQVVMELPTLEVVLEVVLVVDQVVMEDLAW
jgi:hypothetical protein